MTWKIFELKVNNGPLQLMLDDRFLVNQPGAELPVLTCLRIWCAQETGGYFWNASESETLDKIEDDALRLADEWGDGWVVYVHRRAQAGRLDYYFYSGGTANLEKLASALAALHPEYRLEAETSQDPKWKNYTAWFAEAVAGMPNTDFKIASDRRIN